MLSNDPLAEFRTKRKIWTPANGISFLRILLVVPAIWFLSDHRNGLAAATFAFAYATDLIDGLVARKTNDVSEYGKIIDPLADKIFVGGVVIAMLALGEIPLWFVIVVLSRDALILLAGIWAGRRFQVVLPSNYPGKGAVLTISLTLFLITLGLSGPVLVFMEALSVVLMTVSLAFYAARLIRLVNA